MPDFISEPITPVPGAFDRGAMSSGLASLPTAFAWRGKRYEIVECLEHVKLTSREGATAQGEAYLRRQRFTVRLHDGSIAVIDFHRQTQARRTSRAANQRWTLYTIEPVAGPNA